MPPSKIKDYCFDIDGTLCTNTNGLYDQAQPFSERIAQINALYDAGCRVVLYTARGSKTGIDWTKTTKSQLASWGVRYHELFFGKPYAEIYVDDKAINSDVWFKK